MAFPPPAPQGGVTDSSFYNPLWDYADTLRWTHGKHSVSAGAEYRRPESTGWNSSAYTSVSIGNMNGAPPFFPSIDPAVLPGTTRNNAGALLNTMSGAINSFGLAPLTPYWIDGYNDVKNGTWQDSTTAPSSLPSGDPYGHQTRKVIQNEFS